MALNYIDLRKEFGKLIDGDEYNVGIMVPIIHRVLDGTKRCMCNPEETAGTVDTYCKYCDGMGYMWKEHVVESYISQGTMTIARGGDVGVNDIFYKLMMDQSETFLIYTKSKALPPKIGDVFYQIRLDNNGGVYYLVDNKGGKHIERLNKFIVVEASKILGDDGKVEYTRTSARKDQTWLKNDQGNKRY